MLSNNRPENRKTIPIADLIGPSQEAHDFGMKCLMKLYNRNPVSLLRIKHTEVLYNLFKRYDINELRFDWDEPIGQLYQKVVQREESRAVKVFDKELQKNPKMLDQINDFMEFKRFLDNRKLPNPPSNHDLLRTKYHFLRKKKFFEEIISFYQQFLESPLNILEEYDEGALEEFLQTYYKFDLLFRVFHSGFSGYQLEKSAVEDFSRLHNQILGMLKEKRFTTLYKYLLKMKYLESSNQKSL